VSFDLHFLAKRDPRRPLDPDLLDRVYAIRRAVRHRDARPNDGRCGNVAEALAAQLGWERQWGYLRLLDETVSWVHCWNCLPDGSIVDATADQFEDLWLGDIVVLDATDERATHYLHAPTEWKLSFEDRDAVGTPLTIRCESNGSGTTLAAADASRPWLSLAHLVLQLVTGWDVHPRLVALAAMTLRAKASTADVTTTAEVTRPLLTDTIQHLARRSPEPWIASEFRDPM